MTSAQIRQQFLDFFIQRHGHTFVPSSPVVPHDDPTLLFTNAGMNQFKPCFLGTQSAPWKRVANTQKCIRAGGKHNDLDDVGRSRRHHTFFEMLGNWSFGDYFKRGAIEMSWELLTKVFKLDPTRLHVTCFQGDEANGVPRDTETADLWKEIAGLPDDHIHFFGADNFWEMGETGPCGPCTEIHIDRTADKSGGKSVNGDDPRVMEIWNNVFIQYNRNPDRSLTTLPQQHVDTGMGFERITQVLQNVEDNYAIDLFHPFWQALSEMSGRKYTGSFPKTNAPDPAAEAANPQLRTDIAFRVIADHVRCLSFALTDGAVPSNEGRGYVLRRILRRAVRFGRQTLELHEPFMHKLVPVVVDAMSGAFPELKKNPNRVIELIADEEVSFGKTLDRGISLFDEAARRALSGAKSRIDAEDAFKLHDTYGFPIDLTRIMAEERGMSVDIAGYERLMEDAKERARAGGKEGSSRLFELPPDVLAELSKQNVPPTDDSYKFDAAPIGATVKAIWDGNRLIDATHGAEAAGKGIAIILDRTNFYAEMGGQVGDTGELRSLAGAVMDVKTTRMAGSYVLHVGDVIEGHLTVADHVTATLAGVRPRTEKNHTATHLANWALREVLGEGVQQKGSLVDPDKLRFDFSHNKPMSDDEVARIESLVAERVQRNLTVYASEAPQELALKVNGLRAVFGEKYPPMVRVVSIGIPVHELLKDPTNEKWRQYSIEFCGGTHLKTTSDVEGFVITTEESVSKGVRRIVAMTGAAASAAMSTSLELNRAIDRAHGAAEHELPQLLNALQKQAGAEGTALLVRRRAQAAIAELQEKHRKWEKSHRAAATTIDVSATATELLANARELGGGRIVVASIDAASDEQLRSVIDSIRKRQPSFGAMLAATGADKVTFVSAVSDDLIARGLKAGEWIRETAKVTGGGGGGRPQMAQAGGKDPAKLPEALEAARAMAVRILT
jgi:alanyl-tRNA synthetase